jgi:hypothetical protein
MVGRSFGRECDRVGEERESDHTSWLRMERTEEIAVMVGRSLGGVIAWERKERAIAVKYAKVV